MDIREVVRLTGLERANIRYYESEGLLEPVRRENGYRDYSEEDVRTLLKIKLLRRLRVSLEKIRQLQNQSAALDAVLAERLAAIEREQRDLTSQETVCRRMREDRAEYATLEPERYLRLADEELKHTSPRSRVTAIDSEEIVISRDMAPYEPHPFKRLLARGLDLSLMRFVYFVLLHLILRVHLPLGQGVLSLENLALMFLSYVTAMLVEPLLLSRFGQTPGKWLFGMTVRHETGRLLTRAEASDRVRSLLWEGLGWGIPILQQWRLFKSFRTHYIECGDLPWDYESEVEFRDNRAWRGIAYVGVMLFSLLITVIIALTSMQPKFRGDLTLPQFADNYNEMYDYLFHPEQPEIYTMDPFGKLVLTANPRYSGGANYIIVDDVAQIGQPELHYEMDGETLSGVTFHWEARNVWAPLIPDEVRTAMHAMMGASYSAPWQGGAARLDNLINAADEQNRGGFRREFSFCGYRMVITCSVSGYSLAGDTVWIPENEQSTFRYDAHIYQEK